MMQSTKHRRIMMQAKAKTGERRRDVFPPCPVAAQRELTQTSRREHGGDWHGCRWFREELRKRPSGDAAVIHGKAICTPVAPRVPEPQVNASAPHVTG